MVWIALLIFVSGVVAYQVSDKQSKKAQWAIGAGMVLALLAMVQENGADGDACSQGDQQACVDLEARAEAETLGR